MIDLSSAEVKKYLVLKSSKPDNWKDMQLSRNDWESTEMIRVRRLF